VILDLINILIISKTVDRLHLEHFLLRDVWQSNFSSPIHERLVSGCNVLDVGCGPGAWCLDMATTYKNSKFYGLDISPIFPAEIKPKNSIFQECQILDGIPHKDQTFDFCHMRFMFPSFDENQWRTYVIKEVARVLKTGGIKYIKKTTSLIRVKIVLLINCL
jgi:ubiquinone/menaquinone biosynthesis C-methylase UbiE